MTAVSRKRRKGGSKRFHSKKQWRRPMGLRDEEAVGQEARPQDTRTEEGSVS